MKPTTTLLLLLLLAFQTAKAQVPASYANLHYDEQGRLYYQEGEARYYADTVPPAYTLTQCLGMAKGTDSGVSLDFGGFEGSITYGLIPYGQAPHPLPVFRFNKRLEEGKVTINIATDFRDPYDFTGWKESGLATIGYRLINQQGAIIFDGEISVVGTGTGSFEVVPSIYEGPFVGQPAPDGAVIWCNTTAPVKVALSAGGQTYEPDASQTHHVFRLTGLRPDTEYDYTVTYGPFSQQYRFRTAPEKGSQTPFVFGYTSDSRHAYGGGERSIYGANAYIMKKIAALAHQQGASFMQFTGDLVNGYLSHKEEIHLQYTNWKRAVEPFWHYMPFCVGIGNHEALGPRFRIPGEQYPIQVGGFPFATHSAEAAFAEAFVNPLNGPQPEGEDFPSYDENTFYYTYGNIAVIVLNSDYWYAPSLRRNSSTGGGLHGYIMDKQLEWLRKVIAQLEADPGIDHIFTTQHTPVFPNGGHKGDDMWYNGDNSFRPSIAGQPVEKGIIQRRDEYLDILINQSTKAVAVLTGDEHNYNWLKLTPEVPIYPPGWPYEQLQVSRPLYQINNGAAGAPYYGQEELPWSAYTQSFSVENALCLFYIDGKKVEMRVINPDTLNEIDRVQLR
jgi:hypothetical protein